MKAEILDQIKKITKKFIDESLSIKQNFPRRINNDVVWEGFQNLGFVLKGRPYFEIYSALLKGSDFNFFLFDGAIIQLKYKFHYDNIIEHVLVYYPHPNEEKYIDSPETFEEFNYSSRLFTENDSRNYVSFPLRFDYKKGVHTDLDHPESHGTFGNYESCRIPVTSPLTPFKFISFILRSFYFQKFKEIEGYNFFQCPIKLVETISKNEKECLHFHFVSGVNDIIA